MATTQNTGRGTRKTSQGQGGAKKAAAPARMQTAQTATRQKPISQALRLRFADAVIGVLNQPEFAQIKEQVMQQASRSH